MLWSEYWNDNPWSQPPSQRSGWARNLDLPAFDPELHEILLYIGCTSSYDRRAQKIAYAQARVLQAAGVRFGWLGNAEPCCGEAVLSVGHKPYFQEIAQHTAQIFHEKGVARLVAISPHCYDVFKNYYPDTVAGESLTALHYTQYLAQLLDEGRLNFNTSIFDALGRNTNGQAVKVTFQDPCYLGRHNGEYKAPRRVLAAIPGVELVEMEQNLEDGLCCGGGGGRMWLETAPGERFSDLRVVEAAETGATILATACPFCVVCLEDSAKVILKGRHLMVMDIAEIAALATTT
jgi:Fe-S oxidoreductase